MELGLSNSLTTVIDDGPRPAGATAPAAFTAGQWSVADAESDGDAIITISSLPSNGGSAITLLQYSIAGGAWQDFVGTGAGARTVAGFTNGASRTVNIRAINAIGAATTSDTKSVTVSNPAATFTREQVVVIWGDSQGVGTLSPEDQAAAVAAYPITDRVKAWNGAAWVNYTPGTVTGLAFGAINGNVGQEIGIIFRFRQDYPGDTLYLVKNCVSGSYQVSGPPAFSGATSVVSSTGNANITLNSGQALAANHILSDTSGSEVEAGVYLSSAGVLGKIGVAGTRTGPSFTSQTITQINGSLSWSADNGLYYNGLSGSITNGARGVLAAALAALSNPRIVGLQYNLGNNDRGLIGVGAVFAAELDAFYARVVVDFPMGTTTWNLVRTNDDLGDATARAEIRAALADKSATAPTRIKVVDTDALPVWDGVHWTLSAQTIIGDASYSNLIFGDSVTADIALNGAFAVGAKDWIGFGASGKSVTGAAAVFAATPDGEGIIQAFAPTAGKYYDVTYTVSSRSAGSIIALFAGGTAVFGTSRSTNGTYTERLLAQSGNNIFVLSPGSGPSSFTLDSLSIVGPYDNPTLTAPAAFSAGQWTIADAGTDGDATFNISTLPADGGSAITALQYKIGAGAWTAFVGTGTGPRTVAGFTNGTPTNVLVRAVNAIGNGADSDTKSVTTSAPMAGSTPNPFTLAMWNVTRAGPGQARVDIFSLPTNANDPIDGIEYTVDAGTTWIPLSGFATGSYAISGITDGAAFDVRIRARCLARAGAASDIKNITATTVAVTVPNQVAPWGAKTISGGGIFQPINSLGQPVDLTASPAPVLLSGSRGAYTEEIASTGTPSVTGLRFTGPAGAPAGSVWRCALAAGGTVDITIDTLEPNCFHVQTLQQASTAYGLAVLGDKIKMRAGDKNLTPTAPVTISRGNSPSGTWTGGSDLTAGNWVTLTRDAGTTVRIGAVEIGGFNGYARYLRVDDLEFWSPLTANVNGGIPSVASAQLSLYSSFSSTATMAVTNCRFSHQSPVTGVTIAYSGVNTGPLVAISCTGGPFWIEGNVINGCHTGVSANSYNSTGAPPIIRRNSIRRAQIDVMLIGQCTGLLLEGNLVTDKLWPHTPYTVTGVTIGNPTVFTVATTTEAYTGDIVVLTGFTGAFAALNGRAEILSAKTGTTLTMNVNTTGLTWDGLGGVVRCPTQNHGDYIQFSENNGATANQINVQIRGNVLTRGQVDGHWMPDGQGFFGGMGGTTADRTGWLIEGNLIECTLQRGISIGKLINSTVRSNTIVRPMGLDGGSGGSSPAIIIEGGANNIYRDNLANGYSFGTSALEDLGNVTLSITNSENIPAFAANLTAYAGHFMAAPTEPDTLYDGWAAYATKQSGGSLPGPIFPGATPYFNRETLTYANPR